MREGLITNLYLWLQLNRHWYCRFGHVVFHDLFQFASFPLLNINTTHALLWVLNFVTKSFSFKNSCLSLLRTRMAMQCQVLCFKNVGMLKFVFKTFVNEIKFRNCQNLWHSQNMESKSSGSTNNFYKGRYKSLVFPGIVVCLVIIMPEAI